jgi:glycosyltransferase involved in cell wall biosynthesis
MRVCIFTDTLGDLNGVARFIQDMGKQSRRHGFDLHIVTSTLKPVPEAPNIHNIRPRFRIPIPRYGEIDLAFPSKRALEQKLLELDPDIVHISTPGPIGMAARSLANKHAISITGTYHTDFSAFIRDNTGMEFLKRLTDWYMKWFHEGFLHVFSRSKAYLKVMNDDIGIERKRSSFLKPGTDLHTFHPGHGMPECFQAEGCGRNTLKALYVGRVTKEKNILFLIDVWKEVRRRNPRLRCRLYLAGDGYHRKLQPKLYDEGIRFLGPVVGEELSRLYASSDLFLFPSVSDTLGQVVMEAQASGLPVVVSDVGGPQNVVNFNNRQSGFVVKGNDREAWVTAVSTLLKNAKLRQRFGQQGYENMKFFNIESSFRDFASTHQRLFDEDDTL